MIDELEKEINKWYEELDKANFTEVSKGEPWPVRISAGVVQYVSGKMYYGFLLGQWTALKNVLALIYRLKWYEEKKKKSEVQDTTTTTSVKQYTETD